MVNECLYSRARVVEALQAGMPIRYRGVLHSLGHIVKKVKIVGFVVKHIAVHPKSKTLVCEYLPAFKVKNERPVIFKPLPSGAGSAKDLLRADAANGLDCSVIHYTQLDRFVLENKGPKGYEKGKRA